MNLRPRDREKELGRDFRYQANSFYEKVADQIINKNPCSEIMSNEIFSNKVKAKTGDIMRNLVCVPRNQFDVEVSKPKGWKDPRTNNATPLSANRSRANNTSNLRSTHRESEMGRRSTLSNMSFQHVTQPTF